MMISTVFCLIIFLEAFFVLFLGTLVITAIASAWRKAWVECCSRRPVAPTMADYRMAFAVELEPDWSWVAA